MKKCLYTHLIAEISDKMSKRLRNLIAHKGLAILMDAYGGLVIIVAAKALKQQKLHIRL